LPDASVTAVRTALPEGGSPPRLVQFASLNVAAVAEESAHNANDSAVNPTISGLFMFCTIRLKVIAFDSSLIATFVPF
jgi:hypothetical protein